MDKPADPATPFAEVYQSFLDDLALGGLKPSTIHRYRYNIVRFEKWLVANGHSSTLASLERTILIADKQHLSRPCRSSVSAPATSPFSRSTDAIGQVIPVEIVSAGINSLVGKIVTVAEPKSASVLESQAIAAHI